MPFEARPDYEFLRQLFVAVLTRNEFDESVDDYDWFLKRDALIQQQQEGYNPFGSFDDLYGDSDFRKDHFLALNHQQVLKSPGPKQSPSFTMQKPVKYRKGSVAIKAVEESSPGHQLSVLRKVKLSLIKFGKAAEMKNKAKNLQI